MGQSAPGDEHWDYRFGLPGVDGFVSVFATNGSDLYIGGQLTSVGNVLAAGIARWDGQNWSALGSGISGSVQPYVYRMAIAPNGDVYAGGQFASAGGLNATNIARWNGVAWAPLGLGISASSSANIPIGAMALSGTNLYVGGGFTNAGGLNIKALARWNGASWSAVGGGVDAPTNTYVGAILVDGSDMYVGGNFTNAGGLQVNRIAKWDGTSWSALGGGLLGNTNATVSAIIKRGSDFYVAGLFTNAGGVAATNIARWDGTNWHSVGNGLNSGTNSGAVYSLAADATSVYAGGQFSNAGGVSVTNIARWDGTNWNNIGPITSADPSQSATAFVYGLGIAPNGQLCAGGFFSVAGPIAVQSLARWDGTGWHTLGTDESEGISSLIRAIGVGTNALYAGGVHFTAGQAVVGEASRWNGFHWSAPGVGLVGKVTLQTIATTAVTGTDVYIGGTFTNAGGVLASNVARWNGTNWLALGSGMNSGVAAIASDGVNVYAGGSFNSAGGGSANRIAKWNGSAWSPLSSGMDNSVIAIGIGADGVYAGGSFASAGGAPASRIARWDGANWFALGTPGTDGLNNTVNAIAASGSNVYVAGTFTTAGGASANLVAKWNGAAWTSLGSGITGSSVSAIAVIGTSVYVAGNFTKAGGVNATNIAKWDGSTWTNLGSGLSGTAVSLGAWGNDLYVGGNFQRAGQKPAYRFSRWNETTTYLPPTALRLTSSVQLGNGQFQFRISASGGASYVLEASSDLSTWTPLLTNSSSVFDFADGASTGLPLRLYRLRQVP
jgi:hypothetical protein